MKVRELLPSRCTIGLPEAEALRLKATRTAGATFTTVAITAPPVVA